MGTSLLKSAALLTALIIASAPAYSAGAGATGPAGTGTIGAMGMPGTIGQSANPGAPVTPGVRAPGMGVTPSTATGLTSPTGAATVNPGMVGGLTSSQQSFLMNFGTPAGESSAPTSAEQMQANAQANSNEAIRNGTGRLLSPTQPGQAAAAVNGSVTGSAKTGAPATTTATIAAAPRAPVANNPGTLAETVQPSAP
jgi:hypothetical protein